MVKTVAAAFLGLLALAHASDRRGEIWRRPLSMFRDYEPAWLGYALFGLLILLGVAAACSAGRRGLGLDAAVYLLTAGLLAVIAATPSADVDHLFVAFLAKSAIFLWFAARLYVGDSLFWMLMHMSAPTWMVFAAGTGGYGVWQKGMILYFVAGIVFADDLQGREHRANNPRRTRRSARIVVARRPVEPPAPPSSDRRPRDEESPDGQET